MVLASKPVASFMRLAARPVGAHSKSLMPFAARIRRMAFTSVVLPRPGPASTRPVRCSIQGIAFRINRGPGQLAGPKLQQPLGDAALCPVEAGQENATLIADHVGNHRAVSQFEVEGRADQFL